MTKVQQLKMQLSEAKKELKEAKANNYSENIKRSIKEEIAYFKMKIANEQN